ncbi:polyamine aminopropyltransferase [Acuticoccus sp. MNP-M23]|uniref:polyamine aminopropyltransferase n=1 Tax=Acuticoccus sp. MNP-M23 TaxID=3072793 RepID=UPI002816534D|nr:polyamine aminopropyltransferase [Acuticoccus sp. MNP-M23]WMS42535.1 polyamine aminopropyltransferase [Acuticoccus sp. MNP-M23]
MRGKREWVDETINEDAGFRTFYEAVGGIRMVDSTQDLAVFQNPTFGKMMILDGAVQVTERDEFIYHEMMAHVALFAHGAVRRVLIVGGGDGGIAREVLRHRAVASITLVEIDGAVVDLCRAEFPAISAGAFDDPRLRVVIADGAAFVAGTEDRFDVIIVDSPDPVGPGAVLFQPPFYRACKAALAPGGLMVTQSGMPFLTPGWFASHAETLRTVFPAREFFLSTVPSYTGGPMAHGLLPAEPAAATPALETLATRYAAAGIATRYYTPEIHRAAFALPPYIGTLATGTA